VTTATVVVCVYTEKRWDDIVAAVESVASQDVPPVETLVVVDHNPALLERAQAELPDVRVLANAHVQGLSGARNTAIAEAKGDVVVFLDDDAAAAADRKGRLDDLAGAPLRSDALVFTGTPTQLADLVQEWHEAGLSGARLRPGVLPHDLAQVTRGLVPELQRRGAFRTAYEADTLRGLLGLARPANRYATA
jgi:glycosyltransferase involved in cell wall biosynthesis